MFAIIVLAVASLVALMVFGFAIHVLFFPLAASGGRRHRGSSWLPAGCGPAVSVPSGRPRGW
jgi:hypothetical protein